MQITFTVPNDIVDAVKYLNPQHGTEYSDTVWAKEHFRLIIKNFILRYRTRIAEAAAREDVSVTDNEVQ